MSLSPLSSLPFELLEMIIFHTPTWKDKIQFSDTCKLVNGAVGKYTREHQSEYNDAKLKAEKRAATRHLINRIGEFHSQWEQAQSQVEEGEAQIHQPKIDYCWAKPFARVLTAILPPQCFPEAKKAHDKMNAARLKIEFLRNQFEDLIATRGINWSTVLKSNEYAGLLENIESFETIS